MYLSILLIDTGENPDRPRPGRAWLRNRYRVHQRLCMAFPSSERKERDPDFLRPFIPNDFGASHVHVRRRENEGFLYRIEPGVGGRAVVLVQSAIEPDWEYAFHNNRCLLAAPPVWRQFEPEFSPGVRLRFRLLANPARRLSQKSLGPDGSPVRTGLKKRAPVPADRLKDWLVRRATVGGFEIDQESLGVQPGYVYIQKTNAGGFGVRLPSCRYDGFLRVTDRVKFRQTIIGGIGPAKAFGFGLLSVARIGT